MERLIASAEMYNRVATFHNKMYVNVDLSGPKIREQIRVIKRVDKGGVNGNKNELLGLFV